MELVKRLRLGGPNAAEVTDEAADAIEQLCEKLETCWEKYEAAVAKEREACVKIANDHIGEAQRSRIRKGRKLSMLPHYAQDEIIAEERGGDIVAKLIVSAIRSRSSEGGNG